MTVLFAYPDSARFGRVVHKNKIYEKANPGTAVKELFVRQVDQILWQYKLAPETINLPATEVVPEIQVFSITLKTGDLKKDVLRCMDQAISLPIVFELIYDEKIKAVAAFKRPNESDRSKWVISDYFETPWMKGGTHRSPLPMVLDLEVLYGYILNPLMPFPSRPGEEFKTQVERMELIQSRQFEIQKTEARLRKEKQFNRIVEINAELRALKIELEGLI